MRKLIASANAAQERFVQVVEYYNESVDVLKSSTIVQFAMIADLSRVIMFLFNE